nr:EI24 domain-containing protein [uncultured Massilia sp.]
MPETDLASRLRRTFARLGAALRETGTCLGLGLRDALHPRLMAISVAAWLLAFVVWTVLFFVWRQEVLSLSGMLALLLAFGVFGAVGPASAGGAATVSGMAAINPIAFAWFGSALLVAAGIFALMMIVLPFVLYGLAMLLSMRVVLKLTLMERIRQVVMKRYPAMCGALRIAVGTRVLATLRQWLNLIVCVLICLMVPMLGAVMLFLLLCYWNAYGLVDRALDGIAGDEERTAIVKGQKTKLMVLGAASAVITFIPLIGLIGPVVTGASVSHFVMRRLAALRMASVQPDGVAAY